MLYVLAAAVRTSDLALIVLMQGEGLFEVLAAIVAVIIVHGHKIPPSVISERFYAATKSSEAVNYFFSENFIEAWVFSQLSCNVQLPSLWFKLIVKFSTEPEVFDTDMGTRANSSDSYL